MKVIHTAVTHLNGKNAFYLALKCTVSSVISNFTGDETVITAGAAVALTINVQFSYGI